jgi:hypothetical protein
MQERIPILSGTREIVPPEHLENRKQIAIEQEDKEAFKKSSSIIQREQKRNFGAS